MSGIILPVTTGVEPVDVARSARGSAERDPGTGAFGLLLAALLPGAQTAAPRLPNLDAHLDPAADGELEEGTQPDGEVGASTVASSSGSAVPDVAIAGAGALSGAGRPGGAVSLAAQSPASPTQSEQPVNGGARHAIRAGLAEFRAAVEQVVARGSEATPDGEAPADPLPAPLRGDDTGVLRRAARAAAPAVAIAGAVSPARVSRGMVDVTRIERSLGALQPEFRVRLERVIARMETEHGHRVDVVETLRHQARQNQLFEQGRSEPGQVVTWTRSSNHTRGLAADVIIDGSYNNAAAYARLHRVAQEEGLRTLGARDPGHLELPRGRGVSGRPELALHGSTSAGHYGEAKDRHNNTRHRAVPARPSADGVAQVARVAEPAAVSAARVATVAAPAVARVATVAAPGKRAGGSAPAAEPASTPAPDHPRVAGAAFAMAEAPRPSAYEASSSNPLRAGAAERIAHLLDVQSSAPMRPLSQVLLRVDGPAGEDRIRLDLRGTSLGATLDIHDPAGAERLNARIGELRRALEQRGLETESLRIRTAPRTDTVEISKLAAAIEAEANRTGAVRGSPDSSPSRDRPHDSPRDEPRHNPADSRQRSRKDPNGGKNT